MKNVARKIINKRSKKTNWKVFSVKKFHGEQWKREEALRIFLVLETESTDVDNQFFKIFNVPASFLNNFLCLRKKLKKKKKWNGTQKN